MAANRGGVTLLVLLLYCWQEAELQPIRMFAGPTTEMPPSSKSQEELHGVLDEILVQEMLDPSKSTLLETQRPLGKSTESTKKKNAGIDDQYQVGGPESYKLSDNSQLSAGSEDKILNDVKKKSKEDQNENLSVLDKILENIGRSPGHSFR